MSKVLVDTSALVALLDRSDPDHDRVRTAFAELGDAVLVTHGYVVAEALAVTRRRFGVAGISTLIDDVLPVIEVRSVSVDEHADALARYRGSLPSGTSFVDQITLVLAERDAIDAVYALDPDLAAAGARLIPEL